MAKYRQMLPQGGGRVFLTDAGIETTLIFQEGQNLPYFAAFDLLKNGEGTDTLKRYYRRHGEIARKAGTGFVLESATWRSSPDWGRKIGYSMEGLDAANHKAIEILHELRDELETPASPFVISGCIGPRGDGYDPGRIMTPEAAEAYHARQVNVFAAAGADMVTAITMTNVPEAIGIVRASKAAGMPVVISFTLETDGRLPTGESLQAAIEAVDAATEAGPSYYMINCAHPTHFEHVLSGGEWIERIRGIRANASKCSHAELDEAEALDEGDPIELGRQYAEQHEKFPWINVLGGCCGTDHRHIEQISIACRAAV